MTDQTDLFNNTAEGFDEELITLGYYAEKAYLDYAVSVVKGRALPEVSDGQKPVQRRILYAMNEMNLKAGARPVKSARVVGDVLGKFHPHGDQAAYDAMVRMAQNFTLRYPLIDGQGNFGSRDGDGAAAMRYTEARLTPIAEVLLSELNEGTVELIPNYDGSQNEPEVLPARLPMMLLNGASGIAVGMATEIPSHNLNEVVEAAIALLRKPNLQVANLLNYIKGPDFATGAQIISSPEEIEHIYTTGRGSVKVRAKWVFEELARGQWQLVVTELPPNTSSQKVLEEIEEITNPKVRSNRKSITSDQQQNKSAMLSLLDTVRDESGKEASVRLVFEPKTSKVNREELVNQLLAQTSMEANVSVNLVCIGIDSLPRQKNLHEILTDWLVFRKQTVTRRTEYRLNKVIDRIHVLEGRMLVYLNVDEVIATIRESDQPKQALMKRFNLSDRQAEDILEMRLRQLAKLEGIKIEQELEDKKQQRDQLQHLLDEPKALQKLMIQELKNDAKTFGDARRTQIEEAQRAVLEVKVVDEPVTVIVSEKGWLRARQGHGHDASLFSFKSGDKLYASYECRSTDYLLAFADDGRVYTVNVSELPSARGDGQPITSMIELQARTKIKHIITGSKKDQILILQSNGIGFSAQFSDMMSRQKAGKQFISIEAELLRPQTIPADALYLVLLSFANRLLIIELSEVKKLKNGGRGTILIALDDKDYLAQALSINELGLKASGIYRKKETEEQYTLEDLSEYLAKRARKGKLFKTKVKQMILLPNIGNKENN